MRSSTSSPPSSSERALEVHRLVGPARAPLIFDIDLFVARGETLLILGPAQSGKSMLMRHLVGLECASAGTIAIDGHSFDPTKPDEKALRGLRARVGVLFEGSALLRRISVLENVELPLLEHLHSSRAYARDAARELLAEVGLEVDDDTMPVQLQRAGQRRAALARALALRPRLLLLDEPTLALDSQAAHEFDETLHALQKKYDFGIVIFSHEIRHAYAPANQIDVLAGGRIVARGTRESLLQSDDPVIHGLLHRRERER
jgi:ABC-type transporter Mla maintaining outer membrane lipid asymmetry ATPase subunit MlaF